MSDVFEWDVPARCRLPTLAEFEAACLKPNRPGIIRGYSSMAIAAERAVDPSSNVLMTLSHLADHAPPSAVAPVVWQPSTKQPRRSARAGATTAADSVAEHGGNHTCGVTPLREFLNRPAILRAIRSPGEAAAAQCTGEEEAAGLPESGCTAAYLKDWHLCTELAADGPLHSCCPEPIRSEGSAHSVEVAAGMYGGHPPFLGPRDWLNDLCDFRSGDCAPAPAANAAPDNVLGGGTGGDYRFCYIGDAGTWTPLHVDVYGSYSWSLNVAGSKEWFFARHADFGAHWAAYLSRPGTPGQCMPPDIRCSTLDFEHVTQRAGDLVFVPSMYLHQVHNEAGAAVSVNHNWAAEWNAALMFEALAAECESIAKMVDADAMALFQADGEWEALRDRMLMGSGGWSVGAFADYLRRARRCRRHCHAPSDEEEEDEQDASPAWLQLIDSLLARLDRL